jgi:signal transduction histidine kinase
MTQKAQGIDALVAMLVAFRPIFSSDVQQYRRVVIVLSLIAYLPLAVLRRWVFPVAVLSGVTALVLTWFGEVNQLALICSLYHVGRRYDGKALRNTIAVLGVLYGPLVFFSPALGNDQGKSRENSAGQEVSVTASLPIPTGSSLANRVLGTIVFTGGLLIGPAAVGRLVSVRKEKAGKEREESLSLERIRIARDLHDSVTHSLTVVTIQAAGLKAVLAADPLNQRAVNDASSAAQNIEDAARASISGMRRLLIGLRTEADRDHAADFYPVTLRSLSELINEGSGEVFSVLGTWREVSDGVGIALYRVAQESLTNARRHAPGHPAEVLLSFEAEAVELVIQNAIANTMAKTNGYGLVGMGERIRLVSGTLAAGVVGQQWIVRAHVPETQSLGARS